MLYGDVETRDQHGVRVEIGRKLLVFEDAWHKPGGDVLAVGGGSPSA